MFSERIRQRLEALNRMPTIGAAGAAAADVAAQDLKEVSYADTDGARWSPIPRAAPSHWAFDSNPVTPLVPRDASDEPALPGHEVVTDMGTHWLIRRPLAAIWPQGARFWAGTGSADGSVTAEDESADADADRGDDARAWRRAFPNRCVLLDLETCGLSGAMIFLVGLIHWHDQQMTLTQLWARNYAEEAAILSHLWILLESQSVLATFNGKSFDWPQVRDRSVLHRVLPATEDDPLPDDRVPGDAGAAGIRRHIDLLHHARRQWRSQLPNCRLQTLERYICGRHRVGDVPGSEIPTVYHDYVRTGQTRQVRAVLHHNVLDLITLLQVALAMFKTPARAHVDGRFRDDLIHKHVVAADD